jgi:hypothetical protein
MSSVGIDKNEHYIQLNATIKLTGYQPIDVFINKESVCLKQHNSNDDVRILKNDVLEFIESLKLLLADAVI